MLPIVVQLEVLRDPFKPAGETTVFLQATNRVKANTDNFRALFSGSMANAGVFLVVKNKWKDGGRDQDCCRLQSSASHDANLCSSLGRISNGKPLPKFGVLFCANVFSALLGGQHFRWIELGHCSHKPHQVVSWLGFTGVYLPTRGSPDGQGVLPRRALTLADQVAALAAYRQQEVRVLARYSTVIPADTPTEH